MRVLVLGVRDTQSWGPFGTVAVVASVQPMTATA
jgi:hypothetical protein